MLESETEMSLKKALDNRAQGHGKCKLTVKIKFQYFAPISASRGSIGAGFLVQKQRISTTSGSRRYFKT